MSTKGSDERLQELVRQAVTEAFEQQREKIVDAVLEAFEDAMLVQAMEEADGELVDPAKVERLLVAERSED